MKKIKLLFIFLFVGLFLNSCNKKSNQTTELLFYCAAGLKTPIEEIIHQYKIEYGINVNVQYGGSGTLLSNMRISNKGDLYLSADNSFLEMAQSYNLIDETQALAFQNPVIITIKENPKQISSLHDFMRKDVSFCLGTPEAASIGKTTKIIFEKRNEWEQIKAKTKVFKPTVFDIANDVKLKTVDAGIVWDAVAKQYPELKIINDTLLEKFIETVSVSVLETSTNPTEALRFIRYLSAKDKGIAIFKKHHFKVIEGDIWNEKPEILFFSGGVNRVAAEEIIKKFEIREGISINRVYNGCGILVGQIKTGQQPDAFLTCDVSYMDQVSKQFFNIQNVSQTDIVIATKKGNPLQIQSLSDLKKNSLKIGVCNPQQSALGALTQQLFTDLKLEAINKNVCVQTPTADLLINQLRTGALDAAIVYMVNTTHVKEYIDIISIKDKKAFATQNIGLNVKSENKNLMKRFIDAVKSYESEKYYIESGFTIKD